MNVYKTLHPNPFLYTEEDEKIYYEIQKLYTDMDELESILLQTKNDDNISELEDDVDIIEARIEHIFFKLSVCQNKKKPKITIPQTYEETDESVSYDDEMPPLESSKQQNNGCYYGYSTNGNNEQQDMYIVFEEDGVVYYEYI